MTRIVWTCSLKKSSNAFLSFSLRCPGASLVGGRGGVLTPPAWRRWRRVGTRKKVLEQREVRLTLPLVIPCLVTLTPEKHWHFQRSRVPLAV